MYGIYIRGRKLASASLMLFMDAPEIIFQAIFNI